MTHPEIQSYADAVEKWAGTFYKNSMTARKHFVVCGLSGTGKSHTSEQIYNWVRSVRVMAFSETFWSVPPRVEWIEWGKICGLDRNEFNAWLNGHQGDGVRPGTDLLFLEDIGCETDPFKSGEPVERLRELLNDFASRWLFITTNLHESQWVKRWDQRIADRLKRNSTIVQLTGVTSYADRKI